MLDSRAQSQTSNHAILQFSNADRTYTSQGVDIERKQDTSEVIPLLTLTQNAVSLNGVVDNRTDIKKN